MPKKQIEVIDMNGAKTVAKKKSVITTTKRIFAIISIIWIVFIAWFPLYVKKTSMVCRCSLICNVILLNNMNVC